MKKFLIASAIALSMILMPSLASAQEKVIAQVELKIKGPSLWSKIARVATLGIVQVGTDTIRAGQPFQIVADHDGVDTIGYKLTMNGQLVTTLPVSSLTNGVISYYYPTGLPKGSYTFIYIAYGDGGETPSDALGLFSQGAPNKATNLRIIK